jgi:hypothetical protein
MCDSPSHAPRKIRRPRWGLLYGATLPQLAVLLGAEAAGLSNAARMIVRWVLVLSVFVGMALWIRSNRPAFDLQQWCECAPATITVRVIESRQPARLDRPEPFVSPSPEAEEDYELAVEDRLVVCSRAGERESARVI